MRENFNLLLIQLFFKFILFKKSKLYFITGFIIGYSAMTSSIWMIMLITLIYIFYKF